MSVSGTALFVANGSKISEYNATTGNVVNASFITGLNAPHGLFVLGNDLYIANFGGNTVSEYDLTTGVAVTGYVSPVTLNEPSFLAVTSAPEPQTWVLLGGGTILLGVYRRKLRLL